LKAPGDRTDSFWSFLQVLVASCRLPSSQVSEGFGFGLRMRFRGERFGEETHLDMKDSGDCRFKL